MSYDKNINSGKQIDANTMFNIKETMRASGYTEADVNLDALSKMKYGPDIYSPEAESYYNNGYAVINGDKLQDPLIGFHSNLSQFGVNGQTNSGNGFRLDSVKINGKVNAAPNGSWLNSTGVTDAATTSSSAKGSNSANSKNNNNKTSGSVRYEIKYDGPKGAPTLVYKDSSGKTIKTADVKDTAVYNQGQQELKKAQENWKKSHS